MTRLPFAVLLALSFSAVATAQNCPHQVTKKIDAKFDPANAPVNPCGSSLLIEINGIRIATAEPLRGCPSSMVFYPAHESWEYRPGSNTYVRFESNEPCKLIPFTCAVAARLLFIPLSYHCIMDGEGKNTGWVTHYSMGPCSELPRLETEPTR